MRTPAERVIGKFPGGARALAALLGVAPVTVYRWTYPKVRGGTGGLVPSEYHERILKLAEAEGLRLSPWDFTNWRPTGGDGGGGDDRGLKCLSI